MNIHTKYTLLAMLLLHTACTTRPRIVDTDIVIVIDRTDPMALYPTVEAITEPLQLQTNLWQGVKVTITSISDIDITPSTIIILPPDDELTTNPIVRKAIVQNFKKRIERVLNESKTNERHAYSIIYRAIARQLNQLAAFKAANKYLLVYSNLAENDEIDFYTPLTRHLLATNPQRIQSQLEATGKLPALTGIQVWLLYSPLSYQENSTYMEFAKFYQHLLASHGATVHFDTKYTAP